jgi:hypothetical protein
MTASYTADIQSTVDWEHAIESVACEQTEIAIDDALAEDDLCNHGDDSIGQALDEILDGASSPLERAKRIYRFAREEINYAFLEE